MEALKRVFVLLLVVTVLNLSFSSISFGQVGQVVSAPGQTGVTQHAPVFVSSPEEAIPVEKKKKISGWTWVILGVLVAGGVVAALVGGGGGGSNPTPPPAAKGNASFSW